jgi:hypothetical protein
MFWYDDDWRFIGNFISLRSLRLCVKQISRKGAKAQRTQRYYGLTRILSEEK